MRRRFLGTRQIGFIERAIGLGFALQFAQPDLGLARRSRNTLELIEVLLQRRFARARNVVFVPGAVQNPADFLVDQLLGVAPLSPDVGDERMARAVFAGKIGFILGDFGVLGTQFRDHLRGNGRVDAAGIAAGFRDGLDLLMLCPRLRGLHARGNQLVVDVGDLLVVECHALGHRQIVG